ncbi:LysR family transcriptional regulator [Amycolatopsis sp. cg13]|uniref:LysR family transcriptional regulator n=1 Tax=Amycolatopsis sp. cg13 TaxID=3238807 RepID=UPI003525D4B1
MQIEVRHARIVAALAEMGSISRAAARLDLPQPSVSAQLRRIERLLGGELFVRSSVGVLPTPRGERLIPMLVELADRAEAVMAEAFSLSATVVKIGVAEGVRVSLTKAIREAVGDRKIQTVTMEPDAALGAVGAGAITAALVPALEVPGPALHLDPGLDTEVVLREPICLALPFGHPYAAEPMLSSAQLAGLTWVRHTPGHRFRAVEERLFSDFGSGGPEVVHEVGGQVEALNWVRQGEAAALTTPTGPIQGVELVAVREIPSSKVGLFWRKGAIDADAVELLLDALRAHFRELSLRVPSYRAWLLENVDVYPELSRLMY